MNHMASARPAAGGGIPKALVHKHDASQVLLSALERTGDDEFAIAADWDHAGRLMGSQECIHNRALLLTETIRQSFPLISHVGYGVPFTDHLVWDQYRYALAPRTLESRPITGPCELRVRCHDIARRRGRVARLAMEITVERHGERLAAAHSRFSIQSPAIYQRLRARRIEAQHVMDFARGLPLPPPVSGGSEDFRDAVLSATDERTRWQLRIDVNHPVYFDHPVDHAPGILLLEAAQQAARTMNHPRPGITEAMEARFHRYVELDRPCWVETRPLPDDQQDRPRLLVTAYQDGDLCFTALVSVTGAS